VSSKILQKLAKAKANLVSIEKSSDNPFYKSSYADLNSHLDLINPELKKVGLDMGQPVDVVNGSNCVCTRLTDTESGEILTVSQMAIPVSLTDPQKIGACVTYFRRFALNALFNLKSVDDDGNTAAGHTDKPQVKTAKTETKSSFRDGIVTKKEF
jgi:hypothetical protein